MFPARSQQPQFDAEKEIPSLLHKLSSNCAPKSSCKGMQSRLPAIYSCLTLLFEKAEAQSRKAPEATGQWAEGII